MPEDTDKSEKIRLRLGPVATRLLQSVPVDERSAHLDKELDYIAGLHDQLSTQDHAFAAITPLQGQLAEITAIQKSMFTMMKAHFEVASRHQKLSRELLTRSRTDIDIRDGVFDRMGKMLDQQLATLSDEERELENRLFNPAVKLHDGGGSTHKSAEDRASEALRERYRSPNQDLTKNR